MNGRSFLLGVAIGVAATLLVTRQGSRPTVRKPTATEKALAKDAFDRVKFTDAQRRALYLAGEAVSQAKHPMETLPADIVSTLRGIDDMLAKVDCSAAGTICDAYRVDLDRCFGDAATILAQRRRNRDSIPYDLFQSAVGAYAVNYDSNLHSPFNVAEHCRILAVAQVEYPRRGDG